MKAYVVGSWKGENYESFLEVQRILELAGYEVLKQQDLVGKKLKPEEAIVKKEQLLGVSDFVVRLWTEDLPKDENAASRLVSPILEKGKLHPDFAWRRAHKGMQEVYQAAERRQKTPCLRIC